LQLRKSWAGESLVQGCIKKAKRLPKNLLDNKIYTFEKNNAVQCGSNSIFGASFNR